MELADRIREAVADRYAVEGELGRGGMAVVFLARDLRYDRRVAIKVLRPELSVSLVGDRFLREIQIAAQLQHPLIVPLYDSGGRGELLWYVMPFVEGETLRGRMQRERQLPMEDALRITGDAAAALQCAHEHGFVHRDIKPENILLSGGRAVITDFGIARALTQAAGQGTSSGFAIGTPAYMSPEQASGSAHLDARSDVYSLGCVLFEMLTGEPPFTGPTPQAVIARHISETVPSIRVVRPATPALVQSAIERALAKTAADRYPTMADFAAELVAAEAAPEGQRTHAGRWAWVGVPLVLGLLTLAVWGWLRNGDGSVPGEIGLQVLPVMVPVAVGVGAAEAEETHDALVTALEWLPGIRLVGGPSNAGGEPSPAYLAEARKRGARYAVLPRLATGGRGVELTLDLVSTRSEAHEYRVSEGASREGLPRAADQLALSLGLELARRGEVAWGDVVLAARATVSARAFGLLWQGQQAYARSDPAGAVAAYSQALEADPRCVLAYHRLSVARAEEFDYAGALEAVRRGLTVAGRAEVWTQMLQAQRHFVLRQADSAVAAFQRLVLEQESLPDAWLGLAESLFYLGPYAGFGLTDALAAYQRLAAVDSSFAPVWGRLTALALLQGQSRRAREYAAHLPQGNGERLLWRSATALVSGDASEQASALHSLQGADRGTLSLLFLFLTRRSATLPLADSVARRLIQADRTPDDRLRGAQYRFLTLAAQGQWAAALDAWRSVAAGTVFDRWIVEADLAGYDAGALAEPMLGWSRRLVAEGKAPDFRRTPDDLMNQAFTTVVHYAAIRGTAAEVDGLLRRLDQVRAGDASDPMPRSLRLALLARRALLAGDTAQAVDSLRRAILGPGSPWTAFFPLTGMGPERMLLAELLAARGAKTEAAQVLNAFENTWAAGDALYAARLPLVRRALLGPDPRP